MTNLNFDIQRFAAISLEAGETYLLDGVTYIALENSELTIEDSKITGLTSGKVRAVIGVENSPELIFDATNAALNFSISGGDNFLSFKPDYAIDIFDNEFNIAEGSISISAENETTQTISIASGTKIFSTQNNLTLNLTANGDSNFQTWKNNSDIIYLRVIESSANFSATATQNGSTIFSGDLIFGGAISYGSAQKTLGLVDSNFYNLHNSFVALKLGDYTLKLATNDETAFAEFEVSDDGEITFNYTNANYNTAQITLTNGENTILQQTLSISGALVINPATQIITLKKDTVINLTQDTTNILQITALDDAGGKLNINAENISFNPNSNDGALELNFVNQNRKVTLNVTGDFALENDGTIFLEKGTVIDFNWDDGTNLKLTSAGSSVAIAIDEERGLHITSDDENISMELTTDFGYSTSISALKGSIWYNAGKVTFDADSKVTGKGSFGGQAIDMTLETSGGDGYLNFSPSGMTYGAGTGKIKVTMAANNLESTIAVNKGSMIISYNLFKIAEGSDIATDLKTLIPALYFTTSDAGEYTINGQTITTTAANLALTATDDQMVFKTSSDEILYEGMTFAGSGNVTLKPAEVTLGEGVIATGFGAENSFVLTEKGNVTVDAKIFELSENVSSGLTVKGSEDGFTFSRTITEESEERIGYFDSPDIGKIFTEVFTAKGDNSYRISADLLGLEEIIGMSNGVTVDGSSIFDNEYSYHYFNLVTDTEGTFTIGKRAYTITGDDNVAIRARFYEDRAYAGYFESLSGSVSGDFSAGNFHINNSGEMQVFGDTEIEITADDNNLEIGGLDFNASLKVESAGEYFVNSATIEAAAGDVIVGTYDGSARLYDKNFKENILADTVMVAASGNNTLVNTGENVTVKAKSGADSIYNTGANVSISASSGDDSIANFGSDGRILGGSGNDSILNMGDNVSIHAGIGADTISNVGEDTTLIGGGGNDSISNEGVRVLIDAGSGADLISNFGADSTIFGGYGNDSITNEGNNVSISAGDGADTITNSGEDTTLIGGGGNDSISNEGVRVLIDAGSGADLISNFGADSTIFGGYGNDSITNEGNNVSISADRGNDLIFNLGDNVSINAGKGNDYITNYGENILYQYVSGDGKDTIEGFSENDTLEITNGTIKSVSVDGGDTIIKIGSGSITLKDFSGNVNISTANAKTFNLFEDNNFITGTPQLSEITAQKVSVTQIQNTKVEELLQPLLTFTKK